MTNNGYDNNFRKTFATAAYGTSSAATTWFHYDAVGNQDYVTDPRGSGSGDSAYTTYTDYDTRNRKWRVREPLSRTTVFYYDDNINVTRIIRPDQTTETKAYDAMNRVLTDTVPKDSSTTITTTFNYNTSGTINWVKDGNNDTTSFLYDASDQRISMTYPGGGTQQWDWDNDHNPMWRKTVSSGNTNSEVKFFYYDNRNRLYTTWWSDWNDTTRNPDWRYFGYDAASNLIEAENGTQGYGSNVISDVHRFYDADNHLTLEQQNVTGLGMKSVNYPTYDADGRLTRMNVSGVSDYDYTFSYDAMGRFEKIFITNSIQLFQYHYDAASNETERDNIYSGVQQIYPRDNLDRMLYLDVKKGATLAHEAYVYDVMNQLRSVTREDNKTDSFTYYLDGELNTAQYNTTRGVNYTLDKAGNRTSVADTVNGNKTYTPNALNEYSAVTGSSITYGLEHEVASFNGVSYTYINDERLTKASNGSTYTLLYDALDRCVTRTLNGPIYYIYDGEKPILSTPQTATALVLTCMGKGSMKFLSAVHTEQTTNGTGISCNRTMKAVSPI